MEKDKLRVDRDAFSVTTLDLQDEEEKMYWKDKTPYQRLEAMEITRQIIYGYDSAPPRLQRILEVAEQV